MKKIIAGTLLAAALGLSVVGFAGCDPAGTGSADGDKFGSFTSTEQVYGFSAASAATVISAMNGGQAAGLARAKNIAVSPAAEVTDEATIDELNGYIERNVCAIKERINPLEEQPERGWEELDDIFKRIICGGGAAQQKL